MAEDGELNRSQRPLAGVVMCCTSIPPEQRSDLALVASQMGAAHQLDLTSDVTHLIVGAIDTPKYKYVAKERPDVRCLLPEWLEAVRQSWMEGGETNVASLELDFRLPTFFGLRVCVTGFDDLIVRKKMEDAVKRNGGEYRGDLTKEVTHLIAHKPTGKKYSFAKEWGIRVVSIEWLQQSIERGMVLDENLYDPLLAPVERGREAWVRRVVTESSIKRPRDDELIPAPVRKLRRTASARFSREGAGIWTDIAESVSGPKDSRQNEWDEHENERATSRASDVTQHKITTSKTQRVAIDHASQTSSPLDALFVDGMQQHPAKHGLFSGKRFFLHGFDTQKADVLEYHLRSHDAEILPDLTDFACGATSVGTDSAFMLVPHTSSGQDIPSTPDPIPQPTVVTDMWIELCLHRKQYIHPQAHITNSPFKYPVPGFEKLIICCTAFEGVDLLQASKVIKLMGAAYDEYLTERISVLVCNDSSRNRDKTRHAIKWGIPAVKAQWLWDCLRSGRRRSFENYLIHSEQKVQSDREESKHLEISNAKTSKGRALDLRTAYSKHTLDETASTEQRQPQAIEEEAVQMQNSVSLETMGADFATESFHADNAESPETLNVVDESPEVTGLAAAASDLSQTASLPLRELSSNSPPKQHQPSQKAFKSLISDQTEPQHDSLSTAISSLLAHHQRDKSKQSQGRAVEPARLGRRKRQLLGRAASNLSTGSNNGSVGLSRASSVDTMNTDGLGTPLDIAHVSTTNPEPKAALNFSLLAELDEVEYEKREEKLQLTQLGYEDPEAGAWRERLISRMGDGKGSSTANVTTPKAKGIGTVRDSMEIGRQSVSRRTRLAGMR